uniref:ABC transporter permease n=1 Tax=Sutterella wadsworthensis TaxID=40545 RepID=UPI00267294AE
MKASIFIRYFCGSVAVLLLWQLGSVTLGSDILPDPLRALGGFWDALKDPEFIGHIGLSLYRLLTALALAIVVSFPLGVLLGHSKAADWLGAPVTFITLPLPKIVLLPVFFTILGLGDSSRILLIALATGYQILVIVRESALALNPSYELAMRSMGASTAERVLHVYIPAAFPSLFMALKAASSTAVAVLFLAESSRGQSCSISAASISPFTR